MHTKIIYGNCLFGAIYLCLRNDVKRVILLSSHAKYVPFHVVIKTKHDKLLHFKYFYDSQNPTFFLGAYTKYTPETECRKVLWELNPALFLFLSLIGILVVAIPWSLWQPIYTVWRFTNDILYLAKRRINKLGNYYRRRFNRN